MALPAARAMMPPLRMTSALVAALAGVIVTFQLGSWQLRRAAEKTALEQSWLAAQQAPALELRDSSDFAPVAASLPRHVRLRGTFQHERSIWLDNRARDGRAGFLVVTPLRLQGTQDTVLVNRGWAPRDPAERTHLPEIGRPEGRVELAGMAVVQVPHVFQLGGADGGLIRQNLDLDELRAELGVPLAPFVVQQSSELDDALDRRWPAPASGADRNRGYAFQWFSLATLLGLIVAGLCWRMFRGRSGRSAP
jgi:surfeit locus 1 family protein